MRAAIECEKDPEREKKQSEVEKNNENWKEREWISMIE